MRSPGHNGLLPPTFPDHVMYYTVKISCIPSIKTRSVHAGAFHMSHDRKRRETHSSGQTISPDPRYPLHPKRQAPPPSVSNQECKNPVLAKICIARCNCGPGSLDQTQKSTKLIGRAAPKLVNRNNEIQARIGFNLKI